eukprot:jgi/Phyca11/506319/fgenesh2_kg.PHYCAscaffold_19_\
MIAGTLTTVSGGPLHVDSHNFRVSKDGSTDVLYVDVAGSVVKALAANVLGQLQLSAVEASIVHTQTGSTAALTISSPMLKLSGGDVVFAGSAVTASSPAPTGGSTCVAGTLRYDDSVIYFCMTGNVWKKITLTT